MGRGTFFKVYRPAVVALAFGLAQALSASCWAVADGVIRRFYVVHHVDSVSRDSNCSSDVSKSARGVGGARELCKDSTPKESRADAPRLMEFDRNGVPEVGLAIPDDEVVSEILADGPQGKGATHFEIWEWPRNGVLTLLDSATGAFVYEPRASGPDHFAFRKTAGEGATLQAGQSATPPLGNRFRIDAETGYLGISGTGSGAQTGTLASDLMFGARVSWIRRWEGGWRTGLSLAGSYIAFLPVTGRTLVSSSFFAPAFEAEARYDFGRWNLGLQLGTRQQFFYTTPSDSEVALHRVSVPTVSLVGEVRLLEFSRFTLEAESSAGLLLSGATDEFSFQYGFHYGGVVLLRDRSIDGGIFFRRMLQNTSLVQIERSELGLQVRYHWGKWP